MLSGYKSLKAMPPGYRFAPTDEELIIFYLRNKVLVKPVPGEAVRDINANELYSYPPNAIVEDPHGETGEWYFFIHHDNYQKKQKEKDNIPMAGNWIGKYFKKEQRMMTNWTGKDSKEEQRMIANWIGKDFKEEQRMTANRNRKDFKKEQRTFANWNGKDFLSNCFAKDFKEQKNRKIQMIENGIGQEFQQEEQEKEKVRIVGNGTGFWRSVGKKHPIYDVSGNVFAFKIHFIYYSGSIRRGKKTHWRMEEYHLVASGRRGNQLDLQKEEWVLGRITRGRDYS